MVNFVIDPGFVVVNGIVLDSLIDVVFIESVDNLDLLEVNNNATLRSTGHIIDSVRLNRDLHCVV